MKQIILSIQDARKLTLASQFPLTNASHSDIKSLQKVIEQIGYVQIDTISVVVRSHHHILWTRLPSYNNKMLDELMKKKKIFEYWSHAAAYLPMKDYRFSLIRKNNYKKNYKDWFNQNKKLVNYVIDRVKAEGPLRSRDFEHPEHKSSGWWSWKPAKEALEFLFHSGELAVKRRDSFQKVYDLPENVLPKTINTAVPTHEEYLEYLILSSINSHGFSSIPEMTFLRSYDRSIIKKVINRLTEEKKIIRVNIESNDEMHFTTKKQLNQLNKISIDNNSHILSPFDNIVIQRKRLKKIFNFDYQIECYVPEPKRKFGYFCLPILFGDTFIGRMDAKAERSEKKFIVKNIYWEDNINAKDYNEKFEVKLKEFAGFNSCETIVYNR